LGVFTYQYCPTVRSSEPCDWGSLLQRKVVQEIDLHIKSQGHSQSLLVVDIGSNNIRNEGCRHLVQGKWDLLNTLYLSTTTVYLDGNSIGDEGCKHLSQGKWAHLTELYLCTTTIYLGENNIEDEGCRHLSQGKWDHLT
jgi:hypothetical protein